MSDTDNSSYILRYNLINTTAEYFNGADWYSQASGSLSTLLTGYVSAAGTVSASDTILSGIEKLNGNQANNIPGVVALATSGTITPVATAGSEFTLAVSGNVTLNGPSSPTNGQKVFFRILNDGSHSVTLGTGAGNFRFGTDITGYTNSVSLTDYVGAIYNAPASRWDIVSLVKGF